MRSECLMQFSASSLKHSYTIRGFQHFGMTVQNMNRTYESYREVLGDTEIMSDDNFHEEKIHNTLMLNDEIETIEKKFNPATIGVA